MENKIVDRILYESLVTDEVLAKLEREVTECLKPFLGTCITYETIESLKNALKCRMDELIYTKQLPDCIGSFSFAQKLNDPSKIELFYHKPYFRKTPKYIDGYTCYGIEDGKSYKYVIKNSWQERDLIICSVEKTDIKNPQNSETISMLEWDIENNHPSIDEARNAIRTRDANSIIDLLDSMEESDWEHGTYRSFAGRIKNIWRRISGEDSSPSLKEYFNKRTRVKGVKADLVVLDELASIEED